MTRSLSGKRVVIQSGCDGLSGACSAARWIGHFSLPCLLLLAVVAAGCRSPSAANIQLRKDKQQFEEQIDQLRTQRTADLAEIEGLRRHGGATMPSTVPFDSMFTVHEITLGRLTGPADSDDAQAPSRALKVYLTPVDEAGEAIKATGRVTVDALDPAGGARLAQWILQPLELRQTWRSLGPLHAFVLECRWPTQPTVTDLLLKVEFDDALTGRIFSAVKQVHLPPSTRPAS